MNFSPQSPRGGTSKTGPGRATGRRPLRTILLAAGALAFIGVLASFIVEWRSSSRSNSSAEGPSLHPAKSPGLAPNPAVTADVHPDTDRKWQAVLTAARADFQSALDLIDRSYPPKARPAMRARLVKELCAKNLDPFADYLARVQDLTSRSLILFAVAEEWRTADPARLADYAASKLNGNARHVITYQALDGFVQQERFSEAASLLDRTPASPFRSRVIGTFGVNFAAHDPGSAIRWANSLASDTDRLAAYSQIVPVIAGKSGVAELQQMLPSMPTPELRRMCIDAAVEKFGASGDLDAASAWIGTLSEAEQSSANRKLVQAHATQNVPGWTDYALAIQSSDDRDAAILSIGKQLATRDPSAAANWAFNLPESERDLAVNNIVRLWHSTDSNGVAEWVNRLPPGDNRDSALIALAKDEVSSDATHARQLAEMTSDPEKRQALEAWLDRITPKATK